MRLACFLVALAVVSCQSVPRYIVTDTPVDVGVAPGLCIAVDPNDEHGVWWWQAGQHGCASQSTGPGLFHPEDAIVSRAAASGPVAISFRLGTHSNTRPWVDVRLTLDQTGMRSSATGSQVSVTRRTNLDIPEG